MPATTSGSNTNYSLKSLSSGKATDIATNAFIVNAAFRNSKIARSINPGFSPRTNLTRQVAKFAGRAKLIADLAVFGVAYGYSCSALGN